MPGSAPATSPSSSKTGVFYVSDLNYILPTLVSSLQVRDQADIANVDIHIILTGDSVEMAARLADLLSPHGVNVATMPNSIYQDFDHAKFRQTYVPHAALGRFFMLERSPVSYDHIIYLDGDTWISGDLRPLLSYRPPPGMIAASEDPMFFFFDDAGSVGNNVRNYFAGIGITKDRGYFNSGVLVGSSKTWASVADDAYRYFVDNTERCKFHDQSALNAVAWDRRVRLSPRWNFVTKFSEWNLRNQIRPVINHFAGPQKPWNSAAFPFTSLYYSYQKKFRDLDLTGVPRVQVPFVESIRISAMNIVRASAARSVRYQKKERKRNALLGIHEISECK